ncbi:MAG: hypothetical protein ACLTDI_13645 [Acutalibacteraceae bacterium]
MPESVYPTVQSAAREIHKQTIDQMVDQIMAMPERTKIQLSGPVVRGRKGEHVKVLDQARKSGYVRVRIDGNLYELSGRFSWRRISRHNIEIVVDRLVVKEGIEKRLTDSIETVMALSGGLMTVDVSDGEPVNFSQSFSCPGLRHQHRTRWSRGAFPSTIPSEPVRSVLDWAIRWSLTRT